MTELSDRYHYVYSCDLDTNIQVKICTLEGQRERPSYKELASDPMLKFSGVYAEVCSDLYVTCQVYSDSTSIVLPVQTSYKAFTSRWNLLVLDRKRDAQVFLLLSAVGHYSILPLLFTQFETPVKLCLYFIYIIYAFTSLGKYYGMPWCYKSLPLLSSLESLYLLGLLPVELYCDLIHYVSGIDKKFPFLPLLITSVYSAVGVTYCWLKFYYLTLTDKGTKSAKTD